MVKDRPVTNEELLKIIEEKREVMLIHGKTYGLIHEKTIRLSKELDELLNRYQALSF